MPDKGTWIDIYPPSAPPTDEGGMLTGLLVAVFLVLAVLALGWYRRHTQGGCHALEKLAEGLATGRLQPRDACCEIGHIMHGDRHAKQLQGFVASHPQHQDDWQRFKEQLLAGCFAPDPPALADVQILVAQAMEWLNAMEPY